jgi:integrase
MSETNIANLRENALCALENDRQHRRKARAGIKATYRVRPYKCASRPHIKAVVNWKNEHEKRERKFFATIKEAETYAQQRNTELFNQGRESLEFPTWLRVMAQECHSQLSAKGRSLRDATEHYLAYLERLAVSVPLAKATASFIAAKEGRATPLCARYIRRLKTFFDRLNKAFPEKLVAEFEPADCETWLGAMGVGATTYNAAAMLLREFFKWCMGKQRHWIGSNPALEIALEKEIETPVGILTVDQLAAMLGAADTAMLPYLAVGAFAGLRAAELQRLDWSEVDFEDGFIEITAAKAKSARRRLVKMQPCLRAWIEPFAKKSGRIAPGNLDYQLARLRRRAGIDAWPRNALRHSFASYHLARFKNAAELALEMGHNSTKLIFAHYRQVVRESQAIQYWEIVPAEPDNVVHLAACNAEVLTLRESDRVKGTGRFKAHVWSDAYPHPLAHYQQLYGVNRKTVTKWMQQGRPLDDAEAMARLARGEYAHSIAEHATIYETSPGQIRVWRSRGWPLDNVERMKAFMGFRGEKVRRKFRGPAIRSLRVLPLSPRDARAAAEPAAAARQSA